MHLVKVGLVPVELGRALNKAEEIRRAADYKGDRIDEEHARWAVEQAQTFVRTISDKFMTAAPNAD
ncbi:MAG TPA: hypothetical protein VLA73_08055 [Burkholderiales bacterium]|nr:hypothetical protein [Burkholderiales bacterium]